jgi:hypothetical protein
MSGSPMKLPHLTQSNDIKAGILVGAQHNANGCAWNGHPDWLDPMVAVRRVLQKLPS